MDLLTRQKQQGTFLTISIAYLGTKFVDEFTTNLKEDIAVVRFSHLNELNKYVSSRSLLSVPDILMLEVEDNLSEILSFILAIKESPLTRSCSIILLGFKNNRQLVKRTFSAYVSDIYFYPFHATDIFERLQFIMKFKTIANRPISFELDKYRSNGGYTIPIPKRVFDIMLSFFALLIASPVLLIIALLIKLDSKGPIIYRSKRAGSGYKVFDFYKFRSMRVDADQKLAELAKQNQYSLNGEHAAFIKIKNDPRITKLGAFLRNTSLDELPQLLNVLKGDMSLVGNRPLPLYEAQLLTSDEWAMRFLGPAGITGLWQVNKRGKSEMSDRERKALDNYYTEHFSFRMDLKIIFKTIPALLQREKV